MSEKTIKEQVLKKVEYWAVDRKAVEKAIDLTEQLTRKECEIPLKTLMASRQVDIEKARVRHLA